jgi:hypothetical protein
LTVRRFVLLVLLLALVPSDALGQAPGFTGAPEGVTAIGDQTQGTAEGQRIGGDRPAVGAPGAGKSKLRKRCRTTRGQRVCRFYRHGVLVRTCKKKPGHASRCRKIRPGRTASLASGPPATLKALVDHNFQSPPIPAIGRFYFRGEGWCSGTLIYVGVVLTAGHCLHGAEKGQGYYPVDQLVFTPGNTWNGSSGITDHRNWYVADAWTTTSYTQYGAAGYDWGIVLLKPDTAGRFPGETTGTFPSFGGVRLTGDDQIVRMGYPASGPWREARWQGGNGQYWCRENFQAVDQNQQLAAAGVGAPVWLRFTNSCPMNGGSSGGPNFTQFADGTWGIIGVNNRGCGPCPTGSTGWGEHAYNIWFDQPYLDFVNAVLAQINGRTLSGKRDDAAAAPGAAPAPRRGG